MRGGVERTASENVYLMCSEGETTFNCHFTILANPINFFYFLRRHPSQLKQVKERSKKGAGILFVAHVICFKNIVY